MRFLKIIFSLCVVFCVACTSEESKNQLTNEERLWLNENRGKVVLASENNYPPFAFVDDTGRFSGIAADFVKLLEEKLKFSFVIEPGKNLNSLLERAYNNKIDVIPALTKTKERAKYLLFSNSYMHVPAVIITRKNVEDYISLENMGGWRIGVGESYGVHEFLANKYPDIKVVPQPDDLIGLRLLTFGRLDAVVMDIASASYFIEQEGIVNLTVAGDTEYYYDLSIACRDELPLLNKIINKGLADMNTEEKNEIFNKWMHIPSPSFMQKNFVFILLSLAGIVIIVLVVFYWSITLKKMVSNKTLELKKEIADKEKIEAELRSNQAQLQTLIETIPDLVWMKDAQGVYITCNKKFERFFGASVEEIKGKTDYDFLLKEKAEFFRGKDREAIEAGKPNINEEEVIYASDGHREFLETIKTPIYDREGNLMGVLGIARDITDRKKNEEELNKHKDHLEELVEERTKELTDKNKELENYNKLFVGREFRIKELKNKLSELENRIDLLTDKNGHSNDG